MGATRGQHYLPKFLLKGFASRTKEKKAWVYCFRRDAVGNKVSVRDVGKETDFVIPVTTFNTPSPPSSLSASKITGCSMPGALNFLSSFTYSSISPFRLEYPRPRPKTRP